MSSESNSKELRTYRGNCHCGAFVYEAALPEITTVTECPCSICHKKGYIFVGTNAAAHFKVVKGSLEDLTEYTFGSGKMKHKVCDAAWSRLVGRWGHGLANLGCDSFARFARRVCWRLAPASRRLARISFSMYVTCGG